MARSHVWRSRALLAIVAVASLVAACSTPAASDGASLTGKLWQWTESTISEPATIADPTRYTITFADDGTYSAKVDCNQASGAFTTTAEGGITIQAGPMTLVGCPPDSQADVYLAGLLAATSYTVTDTELVLTTATGTMTFAPG
jgi:heat shock protein HslJ